MPLGYLRLGVIVGCDHESETFTDGGYAASLLVLVNAGHEYK